MNSRLLRVGGTLAFAAAAAALYWTHRSLDRPPTLSGGRPALFEPNRGQLDPGIRYVGRNAGYVAALASDSIAFVRTGAPSALRMKILGANPASQITGEGNPGGTASYILPAKHLTGIPQHSRVRYSSIYPKIDLLVYGTPTELEYDWIVAPGADPGRISFKLDGSSKPRIDTNGDLVINGARDGAYRHKKPVAYQIKRGKRTPVEARYQFRSAGSIGIEVGSYDTEYPLIIDPTVVYVTLFPGAQSEQADSLAVDYLGNVYITGTTASIDFLTTPGAFDTTRNEAVSTTTDVFVMKLDPTGTTVIFSTYLGGNAGDDPSGIAVNNDGMPVVAVTTSSRDYPTTAGVLQPAPTSCTTCSSVAVTKLNFTGSALVFSTHLNPINSAVAGGVAIDSAGTIHVAGLAQTGYPVTAGAIKTAPAGGETADIFFTRLDAGATTRLFSTYTGGSGAEAVTRIALGPDGSTYITGATTSADLPITGNAARSTHATPACGTAPSCQDAYLHVFSPAGVLTYGTYFGGTAADVAFVVDVDSAGRAYLGGQTESTNLPTTVGAFDTTKAAGTDGFVARFDVRSGALQFGTYFGGSGNDTLSGLAVDANSNIVIMGLTASADIPITEASSVSAALLAHFVTKLSSTGSQLIYSGVYAGLPVHTALHLTPYIVPDAQPVWGFGAQTLAAGSNVFPTTPNAIRTTGAGLVDIFLERHVLPGCTYTVSNTFFSFATTGGSNSFSVTSSPAACNWSAAASEPWITFSSASGTTSGTVSFNVAPNTNPAPRKALIRVGGKAIAVRQDGTAAILTSPVSTTTGANQTISVRFSDTAGANNISIVNILINHALTGVNACYIAYVVPTNLLVLLDNSGINSTFTNMTGTNSLSNSQCTVNSLGSSLTRVGNDFTLNINFTFNTATFGGPKTLYAAARDGNSNTGGWYLRGIHNVPFATTPGTYIAALTPSSFTGPGAGPISLTATIREATSGSNIQVMWFLINEYLTGADACYITWAPAANSFFLLPFAAPAFPVPAVPPGSFTSSEHLGCKLNGNGSGVSVAGRDLNVTVNLNFASPFHGRKVVHIGAVGPAGTTGWYSMAPLDLTF